MKKVVIAIDSFKGCLSSAEAGKAAAEGIRSVFPECEILSLPIADGGEGMLDVLIAATDVKCRFLPTTLSWNGTILTTAFRKTGKRPL